MILQIDGGEQGDALMSALFCLALLPAMEELKSKLSSGAFAIAYLDDIHIICDKTDVVSNLTIAVEILKRICHIDVNMGKLVAWSKNRADAPTDFVDRYGGDARKSSQAYVDNGIKILGALLALTLIL